MANIDDGGAAFPCANDYGYQGGMTLRDWFAGQALAKIAEFYRGFAFDPSSIAKASYEFADAMLAARDNNTTDV